MNLTKRDLRLFHGLYYYRCLSAKQIRTAYFDGSQSAYRRLTRLQDHGYLGSRPVVDGTRKIAQAYWLAQKAVDLLDIPDKRQASRNQPHAFAKYPAEEAMMIKRLVQLNSFPISIIATSPDNGWKWTESRELKANYENINRNSPLAGLLETKYGERYGVFFTIPADLTTIENYSHAIINELDRQRRNGNLRMIPIIIAHNPELLSHYRTLLLDPNNQRRTSSFTRLVPFGEKPLAAMSRLLADYDNQIASVIERVTGQPAASITRSTQAHATHESQTNQYAEILTFPTHVLPLVSKYIGLNTATPVNLIAWTGQVAEIKSHIPNYDTHRNIKVHWLDIKTDPLAQTDGIPAFMRMDKKNKPATPPPVKPVTKKRVSMSLPKDYVAYLNTLDIENKSKYIADILTSHDNTFKEYLRLSRKEGTP